MKKIMGLLLVTVIFMSSVAFAPHMAADEVPVRMQNKTNSTIQVKLIGQTEDDDGDTIIYTTNVAPGWVAKDVVVDTYTVKYTACGKQIEYSLDIVNGTEVIRISPCPTGVVPSKMVIESHFDEPFDVDFVNFDDEYGDDYTFSIEAGRNVFLGIDSGSYYYSYEACGGTVAGEFRVLKSGRGRLTLRSCERAALFASDIRPVDSKLIVRSNFSNGINLTLIGPVSKNVTVGTGATRVDVPAGTYTYFYAVNGRRFSGLLFVNSSGTSIFNISYFDFVTIPVE